MHIFFLGDFFRSFFCLVVTLFYIFEFQNINCKKLGVTTYEAY